MNNSIARSTINKAGGGGLVINIHAFLIKVQQVQFRLKFKLLTRSCLFQLIKGLHNINSSLCVAGKKGDLLFNKIIIKQLFV